MELKPKHLKTKIERDSGENGGSIKTVNTPPESMKAARPTKQPKGRQGGGITNQPARKMSAIGSLFVFDTYKPSDLKAGLEMEEAVMNNNSFDEQSSIEDDGDGLSNLQNENEDRGGGGRRSRQESESHHGETGEGEFNQNIGGGVHNTSSSQNHSSSSSFSSKSSFNSSDMIPPSPHQRPVSVFNFDVFSSPNSSNDFSNSNSSQIPSLSSPTSPNSSFDSFGSDFAKKLDSKLTPSSSDSDFSITAEQELDMIMDFLEMSPMLEDEVGGVDWLQDSNFCSFDFAPEWLEMTLTFNNSTHKNTIAMNDASEGDFKTKSATEGESEKRINDLFVKSKSQSIQEAIGSNSISSSNINSIHNSNNNSSVSSGKSSANNTLSSSSSPASSTNTTAISDVSTISTTNTVIPSSSIKAPSSSRQPHLARAVSYQAPSNTQSATLSNPSSDKSPPPNPLQSPTNSENASQPHAVNPNRKSAHLASGIYFSPSSPTVNISSPSNSVNSSNTSLSTDSVDTLPNESNTNNANPGYAVSHPSNSDSSVTKVSSLTNTSSPLLPIPVASPPPPLTKGGKLPANFNSLPKAPAPLTFLPSPLLPSPTIPGIKAKQTAAGQKKGFGAQANAKFAFPPPPPPIQSSVNASSLLSSPSLNEEESLALSFDLGSALQGVIASPLVSSPGVGESILITHSSVHRIARLMDPSQPFESIIHDSGSLRTGTNHPGFASFSKSIPVPPSAGSSQQTPPTFLLNIVLIGPHQDCMTMLAGVGGEASQNWLKSLLSLANPMSNLTNKDSNNKSTMIPSDSILLNSSSSSQSGTSITNSAPLVMPKANIQSKLNFNNDITDKANNSSKSSSTPAARIPVELSCATALNFPDHPLVPHVLQVTSAIVNDQGNTKRIVKMCIIAIPTPKIIPPIPTLSQSTSSGSATPTTPSSGIPPSPSSEQITEPFLRSTLAAMGLAHGTVFVFPSSPSSKPSTPHTTTATSPSNLSPNSTSITKEFVDDLEIAVKSFQRLLYHSGTSRATPHLSMLALHNDQLEQLKQSPNTTGSEKLGEQEHLKLKQHYTISQAFSWAISQSISIIVNQTDSEWKRKLRETHPTMLAATTSWIPNPIIKHISAQIHMLRMEALMASFDRTAQIQRELKIRQQAASIRKGGTTKDPVGDNGGNQAVTGASLGTGNITGISTGSSLGTNNNASSNINPSPKHSNTQSLSPSSSTQQIVASGGKKSSQTLSSYSNLNTRGVSISPAGGLATQSNISKYPAANNNTDINSNSNSISSALSNSIFASSKNSNKPYQSGLEKLSLLGSNSLAKPEYITRKIAVIGLSGSGRSSYIRRACKNRQSRLLPGEAVSISSTPPYSSSSLNASSNSQQFTEVFFSSSRCIIEFLETPPRSQNKIQFFKDINRAHAFIFVYSSVHPSPSEIADMALAICDIVRAKKKMKQSDSSSSSSSNSSVSMLSSVSSSLKSQNDIPMMLVGTQAPPSTRDPNYELTVQEEIASGTTSSSRTLSPSSPISAASNPLFAELLTTSQLIEKFNIPHYSVDASQAQDTEIGKSLQWIYNQIGEETLGLKGIKATNRPHHSGSISSSHLMNRESAASKLQGTGQSNSNLHYSSMQSQSTGKSNTNNTTNTTSTNTPHSASSSSNNKNNSNNNNNNNKHANQPHSAPVQLFMKIEALVLKMRTAGGGRDSLVSGGFASLSSLTPSWTLVIADRRMDSSGTWVAIQGTSIQDNNQSITSTLDLALNDDELPSSNSSSDSKKKKNVSKCFIGHEAVEWMITNHIKPQKTVQLQQQQHVQATSGSSSQASNLSPSTPTISPTQLKTEAIAELQQLLDLGVIRCVKGEPGANDAAFQDSHDSLYRFQMDEDNNYVLNLKKVWIGAVEPTEVEQLAAWLFQKLNPFIVQSMDGHLPSNTGGSSNNTESISTSTSGGAGIGEGSANSNQSSHQPSPYYSMGSGGTNFGSTSSFIIDSEKFKASPIFGEFVLLTSKLQKLTPKSFTSPQSKIAFWINVYNILAIHVTLKHGSPGKSKTKRKIMYSKISYQIDGHLFALDDIFHGILRGNKKVPSTGKPPFKPGDPRLAYVLHSTHAPTDSYTSNPPAGSSTPFFDPRILFSLTSLNVQSPYITPMRAETLDQQLDNLTQSYLSPEVEVNFKSSAVSIPPILSTYKHDFGKTHVPMIQFIAKFMIDQGKAKNLVFLSNKIKEKDVKTKSEDNTPSAPRFKL